MHMHDHDDLPQHLPPIAKGLVPQGFVSPDYSQDTITGMLGSLATVTKHLARAAESAEMNGGRAAQSSDEMLKVVHRIEALPTDTALGPQAFGNVDGFGPPRYNWGPAEPGVCAELAVVLARGLGAQAGQRSPQPQETLPRPALRRCQSAAVAGQKVALRVVVRRCSRACRQFL
eukprot:TRINITY_DN1571_c0_g3_i1.p1 TRINITY_DN1571_c0_g3~~TRINITY_DN1571_c0_g3_i1.p1  ORF type:complete len:174 (+),score=30.15 TRINITY_DN1571_c0_g3_i1:118-639(+)